MQTFETVLINSNLSFFIAIICTLFIIVILVIKYKIKRKYAIANMPINEIECKDTIKEILTTERNLAISQLTFAIALFASSSIAFIKNSYLIMSAKITYEINNSIDINQSIGNVKYEQYINTLFISFSLIVMAYAIYLVLDSFKYIEQMYKIFTTSNKKS